MITTRTKQSYLATGFETVAASRIDKRRHQESESNS